MKCIEKKKVRDILEMMDSQWKKENVPDPHSCKKCFQLLLLYKLFEKFLLYSMFSLHQFLLLTAIYINHMSYIMIK